MDYRDVVALRAFDDRRRSGRRPATDNGVRDLNLGLERRPQRTGRDNAAVADAAAAVNKQDREILGQRRILKPVVHDDDGRTVLSRSFGPRHAIARYDSWGEARQQERLVADGRRSMPSRIDAHRAG